MLFITISFVQDNYVNIHHRRPISNNTDYKSGVSNIDLGPRIGWKKLKSDPTGQLWKISRKSLDFKLYIYKFYSFFYR